MVLPISAGYNALMGLPFICRFGAVISVPHFCLRFPVGDRVASHHGDVKQSHTCQVSTDTGIAQPAAPAHQPRIASLIERYSFVGALTPGMGYRTTALRAVRTTRRPRPDPKGAAPLKRRDQ